MFVLDTDHMSALEWGSGAAGQRLIARLNKLTIAEVATTIITYEEQMRGWLSVLAQSRSLDEQVEAYRRLKRMTTPANNCFNCFFIWFLPGDSDQPMAAVSINLRSAAMAHLALSGA